MALSTFTWLPSSDLMSNVVNLRTARKQAKRLKAEQKAAANRLAHGRTKADRTATQSRNDKAQLSLDLHRVETGDRQ
jgi:Domain of unknown function (DUF4169)